MTREEWEDVLFAAVPDEVVQDQLNDCVLSLEWEVAKLRELVRDMWRSCPVYTADCYGCEHHIDGGCRLYDRMRELGVEVEQ